MLVRTGKRQMLRLRRTHARIIFGAYQSHPYKSFVHVLTERCMLALTPNITRIKFAIVELYGRASNDAHNKTTRTLAVNMIPAKKDDAQRASLPCDPFVQGSYGWWWTRTGTVRSCGRTCPQGHQGMPRKMEKQAPSSLPRGKWTPACAR